jgi:methyltransferase (TIGR00027 family)
MAEMPTPVRKLPAIAAFYGINALLLPVTLTGYALWVGKVVIRRGKGVSGTAQGPLSARYFQHKLGTREDAAAARLMTEVPGVSRLALRMVAGPVLLGHRLTGYVPRAFRYPFQGDVPPYYEPSARMAFFDSAVERHLADIRQLVILGAGFDTRALSLPEQRGIVAFEVDTAKTQAAKRDVLEKCGLDASRVRFVVANFEKQDWLARLVAAGFDPGKRAIFVWEGVTMYLERAAIEATLRDIASTAKGSVVVFDYFTTEGLTSRSPFWRYVRFALRVAGEPFKFGVDSSPPSRERLAELLRSCGLTLGEQRTLGRESGGGRAWGGFATALVEGLPD